MKTKFGIEGGARVERTSKANLSKFNFIWKVKKPDVIEIGSSIS